MFLPPPPINEPSTSDDLDINENSPPAAQPQSNNHFRDMAVRHSLSAQEDETDREPSPIGLINAEGEEQANVDVDDSTGITQNHRTVERETTIASALDRMFGLLNDMPTTALDLKHFVDDMLPVDPKGALTTGVIMPPEGSIDMFTTCPTGSGGLSESSVQGTGTSGGDEVTSESNEAERSRLWNVSIWVTIVLALSMAVTFSAFHGIIFVLSVIFPQVIPHQKRYINERLFSLLLKLCVDCAICDGSHKYEKDEDEHIAKLVQDLDVAEATERQHIIANVWFVVNLFVTIALITVTLLSISQTLPPPIASVSSLQTAIIIILIGCFVIMWILIFANLHQMLSGLYGRNKAKVGNVSEDTTNATLMDIMWVWSGFLGGIGWSHNVILTKFT
ncbi:hypothetical protein PILCRDRAFT_11869 [Piloderma croceum F 1598]|uniref:Transmembrane protein n=1 Tax=Piloderma croceum (strain F 1598) TaxID=765440 RepID=A0A0C3FD39_PILCF|nr:hypothetical protein PILCRDRAFT_11869 [Piloderma croceum F 1598]